jgi:hypothetical protein
MAQAKIKEEYKSTVIAFGSSGLPLGMRSDIDQLAIIALDSNDAYLKNLFEVLPSVAELKKSKVEAELKRIPVVIKPVAAEDVKDKGPAIEKTDDSGDES